MYGKYTAVGLYGAFRALHRFSAFLYCVVMSRHVRQVYVPLPHVFPPSAMRQSPTGRELDAIDFVAIAIPSLRSLRLSHIKRRRLIMPLVALVQKNHSAPATSYSRLVRRD